MQVGLSKALRTKLPRSMSRRWSMKLKTTLVSQDLMSLALLAFGLLETS